MSHTAVGDQFRNHHIFFASLLTAVQSIVTTDENVCHSVCLPALSISEASRRNSTKFSVHADCGPGLILLWRRCDTLCNSGFVGDVMFSHNGSYGASCVFLGICLPSIVDNPTEMHMSIQDSSI